MFQDYGGHFCYVLTYCGTSPRGHFVYRFSKRPHKKGLSRFAGSEVFDLQCLLLNKGSVCEANIPKPTVSKPIQQAFVCQRDSILSLHSFPLEPKKNLWPSVGTSILIESTYSMCPINVPGNWPVERSYCLSCYFTPQLRSQLLVTLKVYGNTCQGLVVVVFRKPAAKS